MVWSHIPNLIAIVSDSPKIPEVMMWVQLGQEHLGVSMLTTSAPFLAEPHEAPDRPGSESSEPSLLLKVRIYGSL